MSDLDEKKCLNIITSMIRESRERFCERDKYVLSVWGWTVLIVSILIELLYLLLNNSLIFLLWFSVPFVSYILLAVRKKENDESCEMYTQISRYVKNMWLILGGLLIGIPFIFIGLYFLDNHASFIMKFLPFIEILLCSLGLTLTGVSVLYKPCIVGGIIGMAISFSLLFKLMLFIYPLIIAVWSVFSFIIPGYYKKKENSCLKN